MIPADRGYTEDHEWAREEPDGVVAIGITEHGQGLMGDLVFVEVPSVGQRVDAGQACGVLESVKAAADLHAPVAGVVTAVNAMLSSSPELLNSAPWTTWIFRLAPARPGDVAMLLNAQAYGALSD